MKRITIHESTEGLRKGKIWVKLKDYSQLYEFITVKSDSVYAKIHQVPYPTPDSVVTLPLNLPMQRIEKTDSDYWYWFWRTLIPGVFIGSVTGLLIIASGGDKVQFD